MASDANRICKPNERFLPKKLRQMSSDEMAKLIQIESVFLLGNDFQNISTIVNTITQMTSVHCNRTCVFCIL